MTRRPRRSEFDRFCREALDLLDASGLPHLVIGGLAVIAVGEPRVTADLDVIGYGSESEARGLIDQATRAGFEVDPDEADRLRDTGTLRFRRGAFHVDVILASLPFEQRALERSVRQPLFGRSVRFPTPEDLVLLKVLAGRDKDLLDAVGVVRRHADQLDRGYVEARLREVCDAAEDLAPLSRWKDVQRRAGQS